MKAGRMDIACNVIIMAFFISHNLRENVKVHLIFEGMPDPPKHIEMWPAKGLADIENRIDISKKDVAGLKKKILYKYKKGEKNEVFPGYWIEKKSLTKVLEELREDGNEIFILDKKGENLRDVKISKNCVFVLGDQDGIPKKELKRLKKSLNPISVGPKTYFASQVITIVNNELDIRGD